MCGEQLEAYNAMLQFVLNTTNKRTRYDINIVTVDGVLNQEKKKIHSDCPIDIITKRWLFFVTEKRDKCVIKNL